MKSVILQETCSCVFSPLHRPRCGSPPAPRWQRRPLMWSQGLSGPQSWLNCCAHTLQQPHSSGTTLTPTGHSGGIRGQEHGVGQSRTTCRKEGRVKETACNDIVYHVAATRYRLYEIFFTNHKTPSSFFPAQWAEWQNRMTKRLNMLSLVVKMSESGARRRSLRSSQHNERLLSGPRSRQACPDTRVMDDYGRK